MRILVLGGTTEASALVDALAGRPGLDTTLSLAGRTFAPRVAPVRTRVGGFGGAEGLAAWLRAERTQLLVDATHPFAARISASAALAAAAAAVPLLALRRPPWRRQEGDRWHEVGTIGEAAAAIGREWGSAATLRVLVTIGRQDLAAFLAAAPPRHAYLARTIEPILDLARADRDVTPIRDRGPFTPEAEQALMRDERVGLVVTKNSGGAATYAKIAAARRLALPVVVVRRPEKAAAAALVETPEAALAWIAAHGEGATHGESATHDAPSTERRV